MLGGILPGLVPSNLSIICFTRQKKAKKKELTMETVIKCSKAEVQALISMFFHVKLPTFPHLFLLLDCHLPNSSSLSSLDTTYISLVRYPPELSLFSV